MTQQVTNEQIGESVERRSRGPGKPFPSITFEEALFLPKSILEHGFDGEIQRLTLLNELRISPTSSKTRVLISGSMKYGLTEGSYSASSLSITDAGRVVVGTDYTRREAREKEVQLAIIQFSPFKALYEKLNGSRLRHGAVLQDELKRVGISAVDCQQAAEVFTQNLRYLGLVHDITGQEYVKSIENALQEIPNEANDVPQEMASVEPAVENAVSVAVPVERNSKVALGVNRPALHVDIQVHIDPTSSAEQIDQIFASMAKHLYGNES